MAEKNPYADRWLKNQYNERNPGQRNDPNKRPVTPPSEAATPARDPNEITNPLPADKDDEIAILRQLLREAWKMLCEASWSGQPLDANKRRFFALDQALRSRAIIGPHAPKPRLRPGDKKVVTTPKRRRT